MSDMNENSKTYISVQHPKLKFSMVVAGRKERFAFENGQLALSDPAEIEALDAELIRPKSTLHRMIRVVSFEAAEAIVKELQDSLPKNIITRGGATTAAMDAIRKQSQENAEAKLRAQGLSEAELNASREALEKEDLVVTETVEDPGAGKVTVSPKQNFDFLKSDTSK